MMRQDNLGWHLKPGDGFGHTAMGWFASGRGVVTNMTQVARYGNDAPRLFDPSYTCIDLDSHTVQENCQLIREALEPEKNRQLAENARKRFHEVVNYNAEAEQVKQFLTRVLP